VDLRSDASVGAADRIAAAMYHALLFFHVLSGFFLAAGVVMYSAFALGSPVNRGTRLVAESVWGIGALGTLILGVWLALNRPEYEIYDGWIIAALVLWLLAMGSGAQASRGMRAEGGEAALAIDRRTAIAHWMRVLYVVLLLLVMVWKPGA
jgi:hypothetical protein